MTARIVEFKHAPCRSDLKPLVVGARKLEICLGQAPVRCPHQQQRFDGCPGTAGGLGDALNRGGILIEDTPQEPTGPAPPAQNPAHVRPCKPWILQVPSSISNAALFSSPRHDPGSS